MHEKYMMKNRIAMWPPRPTYISASAECWIAMAPEGSAISKMSAAEFCAWAKEHPNCTVEDDVDKIKPMDILRIRNPNPRITVVGWEDEYKFDTLREACEAAAGFLARDYGSVKR